MKKIKLIILDVDGTLTDGGIYISSDGKESKRFDVQDGYGIKMTKEKGIDFAIITGRQSRIVEIRAKELGIKYVYQNIFDKKAKLAELMLALDLKKEQVAYIGDDLIDLDAMGLCGFIACPYNACAEVKIISDYVAVKVGGHGAVREILEYLSKKK